MAPDSLVVTASRRVLPRSIRDCLHNEGYELRQTNDVNDFENLLSAKTAKLVLVEHQILKELRPVTLGTLSDSSYTCIMVAPTQLKIANHYLKRRVIHDYVTTPVTRGQIMCQLGKVARHFCPKRAETGMPIETFVERKLLTFLDSLDIESVTGLHDVVMARLERPLIKMVLHKTRGNQVKAAQVLGINRNTLRKKMRTLELDISKQNMTKRILELDPTN